jgi:hypothetical protein
MGENGIHNYSPAAVTLAVQSINFFCVGWLMKFLQRQ